MMRALVTVMMITAFAVIGTSSSLLAVNCDQVRRYHKTGRSIEDISATMIVDPEEVKKCLEEEPETKPTPAAQ